MLKSGQILAKDVLINHYLL